MSKMDKMFQREMDRARRGEIRRLECTDDRGAKIYIFFTPANKLEQAIEAVKAAADEQEIPG